MSAVSYARDKETVSKICGVRTDPTHWANAVVHSFLRWTGETTMTTWCGLAVDVGDKGKQTTDLISCLQCAQASWDAYWGKR